MPGTDVRFKTFIESLSTTERYVLILHYAETLTSAEIGLVLAIAEGKVHAMLKDLRRRAGSALSAATRPRTQRTAV